MDGLRYNYSIAEESDLDALLSGREGVSGMNWFVGSVPASVRAGTFGAIWQSEDTWDIARPIVVIVNEKDLRRLCGRYAQLRSELSPLSAWCHVITPRFLEPMDSLVRNPDFYGLEAAWTGVAIAEAVLLAEIALPRIRISACLSTHSFAVARSHGLWGNISVEDVTRRFDAANRLLKFESATQKGDSRSAKIRASLQPIWETLIRVSSGRISHSSDPIVSALRDLLQARMSEDNREVLSLLRPLLFYAPEAKPLEEMDSLTPEARLRVFDQLVDALYRAENSVERVRRDSLALLAGYLSTVAAGGSPSLTLAQSHAMRLPELTAWAYVVGGLGEKITWTSSFDGLGRLVVRELTRPLHLDEPPTCDFSLDEALVVVDSQLADPLVHLRVKQARLVTVELLPGVNVSLPVTESGLQPSAKPEGQRTTSTSELRSRDPLVPLADALWPLLRARLDDYLKTLPRWEGESPRQNRSKRKSGGQGQLPLTGPKRQ